MKDVGHLHTLAAGVIAQNTSLGEKSFAVYLLLPLQVYGMRAFVLWHFGIGVNTRLVRTLYLQCRYLHVML